jgi:hypothetical protein
LLVATNHCTIITPYILELQNYNFIFILYVYKYSYRTRAVLWEARHKLSFLFNLQNITENIIPNSEIKILYFHLNL